MQTSPHNTIQIENFLADLKEVDKTADRHWFSYVAVQHKTKWILLAGRVEINTPPRSARPEITHALVRTGTFELSAHGVTLSDLIGQVVSGTVHVPDQNLEFPQDSQSHMVFYSPDVHHPNVNRRIEDVLQISGVQRHEVVDWVAIDNALMGYPHFHGNLASLLQAFDIKDHFGAVGVWFVAVPIVELQGLQLAADGSHTLQLALRPGFSREKVSIGLRQFRSDTELAPQTLTDDLIRWTEGGELLLGSVALPKAPVSAIACIAIYAGEPQETAHYVVQKPSRPRALRKSQHAASTTAKPGLIDAQPKSQPSAERRSNRNEFSPKTKQALALRAGHVCSMPGCGTATAGPSDESPESIMMIGVAAHIRAAANGPGARRVGTDMTPEQISDVSNGIWLCQTCATIIDRDESHYTPERLQGFKAEHEYKRRLHPDSPFDPGRGDLISIGPSLVVVGKIDGFAAGRYQVRIHEFIVGDRIDLLRMAAEFDKVADRDRYILLNELGSGYRLAAAPDIENSDNGVLVKVAVQPSLQRVSINTPRATMCRETGKRLEGMPAFVQDLETTLGMAMGESPFSPRSGSRIAEYFHEFQGSPWLDSFIKLEIVRLSAIKAESSMHKAELAPLRSVNAVKSITLSRHTKDDRRLRARVKLLLEDLGDWEDEISIFLHTEAELEAVKTRPPLPGLNLEE